MAKQSFSSSAKYRPILISVGLFILVDFGVLGFNFYTSYQIDQDAVALDLSGRQRLLSQRFRSALLEIDADRVAGKPPDADTLSELVNSANLFQSTNQAFRNSGVVTDDDNEPVLVKAETSQQARSLLDEIETAWAPYFERLQPAIKNGGFTADELARALAYSRERDQTLVDKVDDFVSETERQAEDKASRLRQVQTAGIVLALLNFAYTIFQSMRQLVDSDRKVARAQKETGEILATVKEGLFLLDRQFRLGTQRSASLADVLGRDVTAGSSLIGILENIVSADVLASARDYMELLFGNRVKERLVASLNPLTEVQARVERSGGGGGAQSRYLSFQFNRVVEDGIVSHLLVTVQDVTERVQLATELSEAKGKASAELDVLLRLVRTDSASLRQFLEGAERALMTINTRLRNLSVRGGDSYEQVIDFAFRSIHAIKGNAAVLQLDLFENLAHDFEKELTVLRDAGRVQGDDMVRLTVRLDDFFERVAMVSGFVEKLDGGSVAAPAAPARSDGIDTFVEGMQALAARIAAGQAKQVRLHSHVDALRRVPETVAAELRSIAAQLLRNSVVHGIETPDVRQQLSKPPVGEIQLLCRDVDGGGVELVLRDDGSGLIPERIREALVRSGRHTAAEVQAMNDRELTMKIFERGFSTAAAVDKDGGRGVGMDVIREKARAIGGRLMLSTQPGRYAEFTVRLDSLPAVAA